MSKTLRWLVPAVALVIVIAAAALLYPRFAVRYDVDSETREPAAAQETTAPAVETETTASEESTVPIDTGMPNESAAPETPSDLAPDFAVDNGQGSITRLSDFAGKPVVVNFWASWCPPCRSELPAFDSLYAEYGDRIQFMMVNLTDGERDTMPDVKVFVTEQGFQFPVYYDTTYSAANAYQIYSIPVTVFVRPDGTIAAQQIGAMQEATLRAYLEDLL